MGVALSTWKHGVEPTRVAYAAVASGGTALDAVEAGANYCESDLTCMSVGRGGLPDSDGIVTLDASIMDHAGHCGSVAFVTGYEHVASIARRVMERTDHVMLVGTGAEQFAAAEGFAQVELLTDKARALFEEWRKEPDKLHVRLRRSEEGEHEYVFERISDAGDREAIDRALLARPYDGGRNGSAKQLARNESHDTIGVLALDESGRLAGACTTSGLAFKLRGRVGDSPIIGSGLYVDGGLAAAVATGNGELVMRACSTFHVVELIRQGVSPAEACEQALARIARDPHLTDEMQVGLVALRSDGAWCSRSLRPGFWVAAASTTLGANSVVFDVTGERCERSA